MFDAADFVDGFFAAGDADFFAQVEFSAIDEDFFDDREYEGVAFLALGYGSVEDTADGNVLDIVIVLKEASVAELFGLEDFARELGGFGRVRGGSSGAEQAEGSIGLNFEGGARNRELLTIIETDGFLRSGIEEAGGREKRADAPGFVVDREHLRFGHTGSCAWFGFSEHGRGQRNLRTTFGLRNASGCCSDLYTQMNGTGSKSYDS